MYNHIPAYVNDLERVVSEPIPWPEIDKASILVAGANGLIGSFFVDCLMHRNRTRGSGIILYALCRDGPKAEKRFRDYLPDENFHLIIQDVCEALACEMHFDYIIHAAGNAHPLAFAVAPVETMKANILGSLNLLEYARTRNPRRFIFVSSTEIYGWNDSGEHGLKEDYCGRLDCLNPRAAYPEGKRASETLCAAYHKEHAINVVIARPGYIYGPTMIEDTTKADAQFIRNALKGVNIVMKSPGTQRRSYCHVSDMASSLLYLMTYAENAAAYNVADSSSTATIREFAETLAGIAGVALVYENPDDLEKAGYSQAGNRVLDAGKLEALGWRARVSLPEGLRSVMHILRR